MAERGLNALADLGDELVIWAFCNACDRETRLSTPRLIAVYGGGLEIGDLKRRLTCRNCGARPCDIRIVYSVASR